MACTQSIQHQEQSSTKINIHDLQQFTQPARSLATVVEPRRRAGAYRVLVFNPNSSASTTDTFRPILSALETKTSNDLALSYWTGPSGPAIIKTEADMAKSAALCLPHLLKIAPEFDGFLAACYADHPIVRLLSAHPDIRGKPVVGIFDASVLAALHLLAPGSNQSRFGIITTGAGYEPLLDRGVQALLRPSHHELAGRFAGVAASGIGLEDLKPSTRDTEAKAKISEATRRMLRQAEIDGGGSVDVLCMGGVILAGMEGWVHEACEVELGPERGAKVKVVDQLAAGLLTLDALLGRGPLWKVNYHAALK